MSLIQIQPLTLTHLDLDLDLDPYQDLSVLVLVNGQVIIGWGNILINTHHSNSKMSLNTSHVYNNNVELQSITIALAKFSLGLEVEVRV